MTSATEIIDFLQLRRRLSPALRNRAPGEFPPGWQSWLESIPARLGAISGATADAIIAVLAQRALALPEPAAGDLSRWQAFTTLWRQEWHPSEPEERRWRWFAAAVTAIWHLVMSVMLVWLMYLQYLRLVVPPAGEESRIEVEFLGAGTQGEQGGGESRPVPPVPTPAAVSQATAPASASAPPAQPPLPVPDAQVAETSPPQLEAALPAVAEREIPEPLIPPPAEQPVVLSKPVDQQPPDFVLPPTRRAPDLQPRLPDVELPDTTVPLAEIAEPVRPREVELPSRPLDTPVLTARTPAVREREIAAPVEAREIEAMRPEPIAVKALPTRTPAPRELRIPEPRISEPAAVAAAREPVSTAAPANAAAPAATVAAQTASALPAEAAPSPSPSPSPSPAAATTVSAAPAAPAALPSASATPGVGPRAAPAPGAAASARRADDWGDAPRQRPGAPASGKPGLYNSDGSVRIAEGPGSASPGAPPGTVSDEITNLDRAGTWLKRKPVDYQPTRLDKFWMPHETLLDEWVRKGIKQVSIRIPGTSKRVVCVVSLLQLGGGCGISDPNLNEQPATARPPPDIPFKPHLQEDNGSVRPPPGVE